MASVIHDRMSRSEAAEYLGVTKSCLAKWAVRGFGPRFTKIGSKVFYRRLEIDAWLASRTVSSTSELED